MTTLTYPRDFLADLRVAWAVPAHDSEEISPLPHDGVLQGILDTCFHASFATEEGRPLKFRVALLAETASETESSLPLTMRSLSFTRLDEKRGFTVAELVRLGPATDPTSALIAVSLADPVAEHDAAADESPRIWAIVNTGSGWWKFARHETMGARSPPSVLTISSFEPGMIVVSRGGRLVLGLRRGRVFTAHSSVFETGAIADGFEQGAGFFRKLVTELLHRDTPGKSIRAAFIDLIFQTTLDRLLNRVAAQGHGGAFVIIPRAIDLGDTRITDRLSIKYAASDPCLWQAALRFAVAEQKLEWAFSECDRMKDGLTFELHERYTGAIGEVREAETRLADAIDAVALLAGVDGAVVLSDLLEVRGFGAEVIVAAPTLRRVRVIDGSQVSSGEDLGRDTDIQAYGTRHRSAFRLCSSFEDAIAFVASQDGGVKAVRRVGSEVVVWADVEVGPYGLR